MVDFHAVIEKAVDGLSENTPELRAKVYDRARAAIKRQLDNISPPLSDAIKRKQLGKLEEAINDIEGQMELSVPDLEDDVFAELVSDEPDDFYDDDIETAPPPRRKPPRPERRRPEKAAASARRPEPSYDEPSYDEPSHGGPHYDEPHYDEPSHGGPRYDEPPYDEPPYDEPSRGEPRYDEPRYEDDYDTGYDEGFGRENRKPAFDDGPEADLDRPPPRRQARSDGFEDWSEPDDMWDDRRETAPAAPRRRERKSRGRPFMATLAIIIVLAVLVFGAWFFFSGPIKDLAGVFFPSGGTERAEQPSQGRSTSSSGGNSGGQAQQEQARPASASSDGKFTQRLLPDGTEVDAGPGAGDQPASEEGKSTAMLSEESAMPARVPEPGPATSGASGVAGAGEKMILYEEREGGQGTTGQEGTVVWSVVRESPGEGQPPEPAIQAKVNVPSKGLNALVTLKRNSDPSLPASHLIEIVFALSENFEGGGIKVIQSPALKTSEQDRGDTLIAVPAKITETFFMVALNDYVEAADVNLRLLKERNWIDFPFAYENDRRAVMALEKGSSGTEVFEQVIRAWEARQASESQ